MEEEPHKECEKDTTFFSTQNSVQLLDAIKAPGQILCSELNNIKKN
jgi:hypothetical protein